MGAVRPKFSLVLLTIGKGPFSEQARHLSAADHKVREGHGRA